MSTTETAAPTLIAFHGDPELKTKMLAEIRWHREQDRIVSGSYGSMEDESFKGCAVGCSIRSLAIIRGEKLNTSDHGILAKYLDVPRALFHLEDSFFEALPAAERLDWPYKFADAIQVGHNYSMVVPHFLYWLLSNDSDGVIRYADEKKFPACHAAISGVIALFKKLLSGESVDRQEWIISRAAAYAAYAAAAADAADAAYAAYAAAAAAAARRRVREDARIHARVRQSEKLLELLKAAPQATELVTA